MGLKEKNKKQTPIKQKKQTTITACNASNIQLIVPFYITSAKVQTSGHVYSIV